MRYDTEEWLFEVAVRFSRESGAKIASLSFSSDESYDGCWKKIEKYRKEKMADESKVVTEVIHTSKKRLQ